MAAKNYTARAKNGTNYYSARRSLEPMTNPEGKDEIELKVAANMMRLSGYQNDPLAATMNTRSMGLTKVSVNKEQVAHDKQLFS